MEYSFEVSTLERRKICVIAKAFVSDPSCFNYQNYENYISDLGSDFNFDGVRGVQYNFVEGGEMLALIWYDCGNIIPEPIGIASAHSYSHETSMRMLNTFMEITGAKETECIPKQVIDYFEKFESESLKLFVQQQKALLN